MLDLAMKQLEEASKEIFSMDAMKKDIVYNLGLVYEEMGDREKSLAAMKQIYEADYGLPRCCRTRGKLLSSEIGSFIRNSRNGPCPARRIKAFTSNWACEDANLRCRMTRYNLIHNHL